MADGQRAKLICYGREVAIGELRICDDECCGSGSDQNDPTRCFAAEQRRYLRFEAHYGTRFGNQPLTLTGLPTALRNTFGRIIFSALGADASLPRVLAALRSP